MKKLLFSLCAAAALPVFADPVKVILDTDMITDFDDVGALACLHALADAGECEILATVSCTRGNASTAAIGVINGYYGRADLPVGCAKGMGVIGAYAGDTKKVDPNSPLGEKGPGDGGHYKYRKLALDYPQWVKYLDSDTAPDANVIYRKALAGAPDKSVVICSIGFLTNMRRLIETQPDEISPLTGRELVEKKVIKWVAMACRYPKGKEYNSQYDGQSSRIAFENWPTPIVFSDWQYGGDLYAGRSIAEMEGPRNPVKDVFAGNIPTREEVRKDPGKWRDWCFGMGGRAAWDETAVLAAVRGEESYFNVHRGTYKMIGDTGENVWLPDEENGPHIRITEKVNKLEVGRIIDELICRPPVHTRTWGVTKTGEQAHLYTLEGKDGLKLVVSDFGGRLVRCYVPGKNGETADVTPGWDTVEQYEQLGFSMGTLIGRFGNRIKDGRFTLDGKTYQLPLNETVPAPRHCNLHGGPVGWDMKVWKTEVVSRDGNPALAFTLVSPDGDMGFPGTVTAKVTYTVLPGNVWRVDYEATTDKPTVVNLTHHSYWNLAGCHSGDVLGQLLKINADAYTQTDAGLIPTHDAPVKGTGFDFTTLRPIGAKADWMKAQPGLAAMDNWYDHNFVLNGRNGEMKLAAEMVDPASCRKMEIWTTEPCMQMYGAQNMTSSLPGKDGKKLCPFAAVALETQHYPDSPNRPDFPSTVLRPGETFRSTTEYRFSILP